jgi:chromosome segregation ATPase
MNFSFSFSAAGYLFLGLALGVLLGWLLGWLSDWLFWRQKSQQGNEIVPSYQQDELRKVMSALVARLRASEAQVNILRNELGSQSGNQALLSTFQTAMQNMETRYQDRMQSQNAQLTPLLTQLTSGSQTSAETEQLRTQVSMLTREADQLRTDLGSAKRDSDQFRITAQQNASETEQLRMQLGTLNRELDGLRQEKASLTQSQTRLAQLEISEKVLQDTLQTRQHDLAEARTVARQLQTQVYDRDRTIRDLEERIRQAQDQIRTLELRVQNQQNTQSSSQTTIQDLTDRLSVLTAQLGVLPSPNPEMTSKGIGVLSFDDSSETFAQLRDAEDEIERLKAQIQRNQMERVQLDEAQRNLEALNRSNAELHSKTISIEETLVETERERDQIHVQLTNMEAAKTKLESERDEIQRKLAVQTTTLDQLKQERDRLRTDLEAAKANAGDTAELTMQVNALKADAQRLDDELISKTQAHEALLIEMKSVKRALTNEEANRKELALALEEAEARHKKDEGKLALLTKKLNEADDQSNRWENSAKQMQVSLKKSQEELDTLREQLSALADEKTTLEHALANTNLSVTSISEEKESLLSKLLSWETKGTGWDEQRSVLETRLAELEAELVGRNASLVEQQTELAARNKDVIALKATLEKRETALKKRETELAAYKEKYAALESQMTVLTADIEDLRPQLETALEAREMWEETAQQRTRERQDVLNQLNLLQERYAERNREIRRIRSSLRKSETTISTLQEQLRTSDVEVQRLELQISEIGSEGVEIVPAEMEVTITTLEEQISQLQAQLSLTEFRLEATQTETEELRMQLQNSQNLRHKWEEAVSLTQTTTQNQESITAIQKRYDRRMREIRRLKTRLEKATQRIQRLEAQLGDGETLQTSTLVASYEGSLSSVESQVSEYMRLTGLDSIDIASLMGKYNQTIRDLQAWQQQYQVIDGEYSALKARFANIAHPERNDEYQRALLSWERTVQAHREKLHALELKVEQIQNSILNANIAEIDLDPSAGESLLGENGIDQVTADFEKEYSEIRSLFERFEYAQNTLQVVRQVSSRETITQQLTQIQTRLETVITEVHEYQSRIETFASEISVVKATVRPGETIQPDQPIESELALIDINGIGPVYSKRLENAGITTFEQFIALEPAKIAEIVKKRSGEDDAVAWIAEAKEMMARSETS